MKIRVFEICCSLKPEKWQMQRTSVVNKGMRLIKVKVKSTSQSQHGIHYAPQPKVADILFLVRILSASSSASA